MLTRQVEEGRFGTQVYYDMSLQLGRQTECGKQVSTQDSTPPSANVAISAVLPTVATRTGNHGFCWLKTGYPRMVDLQNSEIRRLALVNLGKKNPDPAAFGGGVGR